MSQIDSSQRAINSQIEEQYHDEKDEKIKNHQPLNSDQPDIFCEDAENIQMISINHSPDPTLNSFSEQQTLKELKQFINTLTETQENNKNQQFPNNLFDNHQQNPLQNQSNQSTSQYFSDNQKNQIYQQINKNNCLNFIQKYFQNNNQNFQFNKKFSGFIQNSHNSYQQQNQIKINENENDDSDYSLNNSFISDIMKDVSPPKEINSLDLEQYYLFDHFQKKKDAPYDHNTSIISSQQSIASNPTHKIPDNSNLIITDDPNQNSNQDYEEEKIMEFECHSEDNYEFQDNVKKIINLDQQYDSSIQATISKETKQKGPKTSDQIQNTLRVKLGKIAQEIYENNEINIYTDYKNLLIEGYALQNQFSDYNLKQGVEEQNIKTNILQGLVFKYVNKTIQYSKDLQKPKRKYTHYKENKNYTLLVKSHSNYPGRPFLQLVKK